MSAGARADRRRPSRSPSTELPAATPVEQRRRRRRRPRPPPIRRRRARRYRRCSRIPNLRVTTDDAIGELLALWGAHYDPARGEPCVQAQEQGLRCLFQRRGTFGELRRVNWPTILSLVTADGADHPVVVSALGYDHAQLARTAAPSSCRSRSSAIYWFGDHLLLWRPGEAPARDLAPGMDDVGVRWLRATLAKLAGEPAPSDASTLYDDALEQRVRAYQRHASAHGRRHRRRAHADRDVGGARPAGHPIARRGSLTCRSSSMHCENPSTSANARPCRALAGAARDAARTVAALGVGRDRRARRRPCSFSAAHGGKARAAPTETTAAAPMIERSVELPPPAATFTPPRLTPPAPSAIRARATVRRSTTSRRRAQTALATAAGTSPEAAESSFAAPADQHARAAEPGRARCRRRRSAARCASSCTPSARSRATASYSSTAASTSRATG